MNISTFASFEVKSTAILIFVALACRIFHRLGASYRHLFWTAGFCFILALPILSAVLPRQNLAVLPAPPAKTVPHFDTEVLKLPKSFAPIPAKISSKIVEDDAQKPSPESTVLMVWLLGVIAILGQHIFSLLLLSKSAAKAVEGDTNLYVEVAGRAGLGRKWTLLVGDIAGSPSPKTWGAFRPVIAMPAKSPEWSAEQFETVLMHELVHVRRLDFLTQSLATLACALTWFNPLAWFGLRAMRIDAEIAADDGVLLSGVKPSVYAQSLLQAASEFQSSGSPFLSAGVPLMKQSKIESRVRAILSTHRQARRLNRAGAALLVGASLLVALPCAALQVTEQTPASKQTTTAVQPVSATKPRKATNARKKVLAIYQDKSSRQFERYQAQIDTLRAELAQQRRELALMRSVMESQTQERVRERIESGLNRQQIQKATIEQARANLAAAKAQAESLQGRLVEERAHLAEAQARYRAGLETRDEVEKATVELKTSSAELAAAQAAQVAAEVRLEIEKATQARKGN